jgi:hypothetical protein
MSAFDPKRTFDARRSWFCGQPSEPGPYTIRVKVPSDVKLMPHKHPEDRVYTVISGVFYIGLGDRFDGDKVEAYPTRQRWHSAWQHVPFPLGKVW